MNEVPAGIKSVEFGNPTQNPWLDVNDLRTSVINEISSRQSTASANKAGARLRVARATNEHVQVIADLMAGGGFSRADLAGTSSLSVHFGGRRINIPTFNDYTQQVVVAGVRYAPLQHARWDPVTKRTRIVSAQESLVETMRGLMRPGMADESVPEQARRIAQALETWRGASLQHVAYGPGRAGGALPFYLSAQVAIESSHPAVGLAKEAEREMSAAFKALPKRFREEIVGGLLPASSSHVRAALVNQLALGLVVFGEHGSQIRSVGRKSLRLQGFDPFGSEREIGAEGRLIASTLPSHGYGVAMPGMDVLRKGIHQRRAAMGIDTRAVSRIRRTGATLRGLKTPKTRTTRILLSAFDREAQRVASQHFGAYGKAPRVQLETPIRAMLLRPKAGLSATDAAIANQLLYLGFGEATLRPSSPEMLGIASELSSTRVVRMAHAKPVIGYAQADVHPLIAKAMEGGGVGSTVLLKKPITFEDLGGRVTWSTNRQGRKRFEILERARIGGSLRSTGEVRISRTGEVLGEYLKSPDETIVGFRSGPGVTQALIRSPLAMAEEGTPLMVGTRRVSMGTSIRGFRGVDMVGASGKLGIGATPDALIEHVTTLVERKAGRAGLAGIASVLPGGSVNKQKIARENRIDFEGELTERHARRVLKVAEKYGIVMGPQDETQRRRLLVDIFRKGQVEKIGELYHGHDLSAGQAAGFAEHLGPQGRALLGGRSTSEFLEGVMQHQTVAGRAGLPSRGKLGSVAIRMRDLRMYAVGASAMGGEDVMSMMRKQQVMKTALQRMQPSLGDAQAQQLARHVRRHGIMWRHAVERPTGLTNYLDAVAAVAEGRVEQLGDGFEILTQEQYKQKYGSGLNRKPRRSELKDLKGTPYVHEVDGQIVQTRKITIVKMDTPGAMSLSREMGTDAVTMSHIVMPSGETLNLRRGELVRFEKQKNRKGLKTNLGRQAMQLHSAVASGSTTAAYRAAGATWLTASESALARGGALHRRGTKLGASFTGTLVSDANLDPGEVGLSRGTVRKLLKRQGVTDKTRIERILANKEDYFLTLKTEPMRSTSHMTSVKVRALDSVTRRQARSGVMEMGRSSAIHYNPLNVLIRQRDFDYDPGYLFSLVQRHKSDPLKQFVSEQQALAAEWNASKQERNAIAEVAQARAARPSSKATTDMLKLRSSEMMLEAQKVAKGILGSGVKFSGQTVDLALAQTMAATPEMLTPLANIRWRTRVEILKDVALGKGLDNMVLNAKDASQKTDILEAMRTLRNDRKAISMVHVLAETSEYSGALKKATADALLQDASAFAGTPDAMLAAMTSRVDLGMWRPGTKGATEAINQITPHVQKLMEMAEGGNLDVWQKAFGISAEDASRRMATTLQAATFLEQQGVMSHWQSAMTAVGERGTAMTGGNGIANYMRLVQGRDPDLADRMIANGFSWGATEAGASDAAFHVGNAAQAAGATKGLGPTGKGMAQGGMELLNKLWASKWGKVGMGVAGIAAVFGAGTRAFGGGGDGPPGAPMPPAPMVGGLGPDRDLDYTDIPTEQYARVDRVPGVRTHMQVTGRTGNRNLNFRGMANNAFGRMGLSPQHVGHFSDETSGLRDRSRLDAEIHDRMNSEF